jgi:hypothetical protein
VIVFGVPSQESEIEGDPSGGHWLIVGVQTRLTRMPGGARSRREGRLAARR